MTAPKLYRTTVEIWTHYDPKSSREVDLGQEVLTGSGFVGNRSTDGFTYEELVGNQESLGSDLLDYFNVDRPPLCLNGACADEGPAGLAVALMPQVNGQGVITEWKLTCRSHAEDWWDDHTPDELRVRYDLHRTGDKRGLPDPQADARPQGLAAALSPAEIERALRTLGELRTNGGDVGDLSDPQMRVAERCASLWRDEMQMAASD